MGFALGTSVHENEQKVYLCADAISSIIYHFRVDEVMEPSALFIN